MKRRKNNYKKMLARWLEHAQLRAMERYGIAYSSNVQFLVRKDIENNVFNLLLEIPNSTRVVYRGRLLDNVVTFIFCKQHNAVITFLCNTWVDTDITEFDILTYRDRKRNKHKNKPKKQLSTGGNMKVNDKSLRKLRSPRPKNYEEDKDDFTG